MKAAIYARFSSDNQREESITAQLRACRAYCLRKGYDIEHEYYDEAMTATNDNRPQYRQMIKDAASGLFDVVVMHKVDRGARNEFDYYANKAKLIRAGVSIEYAAQQFDTDSPEGQLMENQLVGIAAYYSRNLAKEVKKGQYENAVRAMHNGGYPPLGYTTDKDHHYIIDETNAPAVRLIFDLYCAGAKYNEIIDALNDRGYKTGSGNQFGKNSIHDILANEKYTGTYIYRKTTDARSLPRNSHKVSKDMIRIDDAFPAIISKEQFAQAKARLGAGRRDVGRRHAKSNYLLTGLIFCGICGGAMVGNGYTTWDKYRYNYYQCAKSHNKNIVCASKRVRREYIESLVIDYVKNTIKDKHIISAIVTAINNKFKEQKSAESSELASLRRQQRQSEKAISNLLKAVEQGNFGDMIAERLRGNKEKLAQITTRINQITAIDRSKISAAAVRQVFQSWIDADDDAALRSMIESFVHRITVYPDAICIDLSLPVRGQKYDAVSVELPRETKIKYRPRKTANKKEVPD